MKTNFAVALAGLCAPVAMGWQQSAPFGICDLYEYFENEEEITRCAQPQEAALQAIIEGLDDFVIQGQIQELIPDVFALDESTVRAAKEIAGDDLFCTEDFLRESPLTFACVISECQATCDDLPPTFLAGLELAYSDYVNELANCGENLPEVCDAIAELAGASAGASFGFSILASLVAYIFV